MDQQYHILVVEDEPQWRENIFREALEDEGYDVQTSDSYSEAVATLDQQAFDLAVVDVNLTGVSGNQDGLRLLELLTSQEDQTPVIVVSGSKTRDVAEEDAREFQPFAFLDKTTFDIAEFVAMVAEALGQDIPTEEVHTAQDNHSAQDNHTTQDVHTSQDVHT
jgi:DNA-binding NtrC family response regulator